MRCGRKFIFSPESEVVDLIFRSHVCKTGDYQEVRRNEEQDMTENEVSLVFLI